MIKLIIYYHDVYFSIVDSSIIVSGLWASLYASQFIRYSWHCIFWPESNLQTLFCYLYGLWMVPNRWVYTWLKSDTNSVQYPKLETFYPFHCNRIFISTRTTGEKLIFLSVHLTNFQTLQCHLTIWQTMMIQSANVLNVGVFGER